MEQKEALRLLDLFTGCLPVFSVEKLVSSKWLPLMTSVKARLPQTMSPVCAPCSRLASHVVKCPWVQGVVENINRFILFYS